MRSARRCMASSDSAWALVRPWCQTTEQPTLNSQQRDAYQHRCVVQRGCLDCHDVTQDVRDSTMMIQWRQVTKVAPLSGDWRVNRSHVIGVRRLLPLLLLRRKKTLMHSACACLGERLQSSIRRFDCRSPSDRRICYGITTWARLRNDLYCVEWDVKL